MYGRDQLALPGKKNINLEITTAINFSTSKQYKYDLRLNRIYMLHIYRVLCSYNIKKPVEHLNQSRQNLNSGLL
jgi:hypothetical protein